MIIVTIIIIIVIVNSILTVIIIKIIVIYRHLPMHAGFLYHSKPPVMLQIITIIINIIIDYRNCRYQIIVIIIIIQLLLSF
jgi:hypothetical protein